MPADGAPISRRLAADQPASTAELINRLTEFEGPPEAFLVNLLAVQCKIASAFAAAILRTNPSGEPEVVAVYPPVGRDQTAPVWLAQSVQSVGKVYSSGATDIVPVHGPDDMYGAPARHHIVLLPLRSGRGVRGVAAYAIEAETSRALADCRERLELTVSLLSLYEMRLTLQRRGQDLQRLRTAMQVLSGVNEHEKFTASAMAACNEIASRWNCERVSIGLLKGRYVQVKATSHTEKFSRKMKLIQDIEAAMEECLDQDAEILYPPDDQATYVSRAGGQLSARHGPNTVLSLPMRREAEATGVITIERPPDQPFSEEEIETLRLTAELVTPRLVDLHHSDRWIGARAAADLHRSVSTLVGPKHTWLKVAAVAVFGVLAYVTLVKGPYRADAAFVLQATTRQIVAAPYDGFLKSVQVEPGETVEAGETVLGKLETAELRQQLATAKAERIGYLKQAAQAREQGDRAQAQIASAQAAKATAQIELLQHQIDQATLVAPISGTVVAGDLKRQIGRPVETGEALFEIAPLESLRAELSVPEDQITDVQTGQRGELATAAYPNKRIGFVVERINPVAEVVNQRNVFKVRARLDERPPWMRPGMEGTARVDIGRRSYAWLWTRDLRNWIRMKLWW